MRLPEPFLRVALRLRAFARRIEGAVPPGDAGP